MTGDERWHATNLIITKHPGDVTQKDHAGVNLIRKYYPDFQPTAEDFQNAKWGS